MSNTQATVEDLIDELTDVLEKGWHLPFAGGKSFIEKAKALVNQEEIVRQAQAKANDIMAQTQEKFRSMQKASNDYVEDLLRRTDDAMSANLAELRKTRQSIHGTSAQQ